MSEGWQCLGMRWSAGGPGLVWHRAERGERVSPFAYGTGLGIRAEGERSCVGVRRGGRRTGCPVGAVIGGRSGSAQCGECARLDRSFSVAADTNAADPRPYSVYLAWFGPGMVKVGITAVERGPVRLLEQGAVAFSRLGRGPLMAARRTEELLRTALGVPDRIPYAQKRSVRATLPPVEARAAEVAALHARAVALAGWPESLERAECEVVDHSGVFGLRDLEPVTGVVSELVAGGVVAGRLVAAAGPDLHLAGGLVVDTRLMSGWRLAGVDPGAPVTVPVRPVAAAGGETQEGLF
ncbi:DUF2797 domain-containing protein [Streptomyces sp. A3M-1-3]|uniref:DUF2797 domain-containing protein n=1 Tax=Streptomyces sp. A3M-1-3 TaxID=2962044 RepID=UPI0020B7562B|nr:DUF2797 domain-containing protein [Streptomyces sp. A3M-1-3]MCP3818019.1 DUF2797 domain-containing protein [Streptomyces sp. A3M-1-3]